MNNAPGIDRKRARRAIVVVGSNPKIMNALSVLLQRFDYEVSACGEAAQALERISTLRPALVITDLVLPDMTGIDFFRRAQQDKYTASVPMIFMINPSDAAAESQCLDYGAAACVTKPVQAEELYRTVQEVLEPRPRASIRIDTRAPVSVNDRPVECAGGECLIDLSEHGMYLPMPHPGKGRIAVQLKIKDRTISAEGAVLYSHPAGSEGRRGPGIGLKFVNIAPHDQDFIRKFIREEVTRDINKAPFDPRSRF